MKKLSFLQIRNPRDDETSVESASQFFSSVVPKRTSFLSSFFNKPDFFSFEIFYLNNLIYFYIVSPLVKKTLVQSLILSSYPQAKIITTTDPLDILLKYKTYAFGELNLAGGYYYPIKTYLDFKNTDSLAPVLGFLSKQSADLGFLFQIVLAPSYFDWQTNLLKGSTKQEYDDQMQRYVQNPSKGLMVKKASSPGCRVALRILVSSRSGNLGMISRGLNDFVGTFGSFALGGGNSFVFKQPSFFKESFLKRIKLRELSVFENKSQILNSQELAALWHLPGKNLSGIKNITWGKTLKGEPPENLPVASEKKDDINFFAKTEFKNKEQIFGIKTPDRRKHIYIIGKTGAGKSTLIANMAIDDIRRDRGLGIIDPHGDLSEIILDYIPKRRINDVVYLEPFDPKRVFGLNVLEVKNKQQKDLVASGIVSIFRKLYKDSWGPRLEYILRNVILTLLEIENATLVDVLPLLSKKEFRSQVVKKLSDPVMKSFWEFEFNKMPDRLRAEAVSPIQNKVGQFVSSKMIRNIIGSAKSTINLQEIMDSGKILILNLSQGKLGEDNASLLGAMIITQIQLAAMNRSFQREEERKDFFLYVDEFQNFATTSFVKILSEARKYRLSLTMANQYIDQIEESVRKAIFGNVGTLISFVVGSNDAYYLSKEFGGVYSPDDLVNLGKYEIVLKLSIDGMTSTPFPAKTVPLPVLINNNKEKIIRTSKEKYARRLIE